ncbi:MAG: deoxyribose-phosphate aldolase [Methanobacterium sp.]|jgi:deoxyribose-phosphate aldolase
MILEELAQMIDQTNVKSDATEDDIKKLCSEALQYNFASACVTPTNVVLTWKLLKYSDVKVCAVVGFPLGIQTPKTKAFETMEVVSKGADEIDMVMNIGGLKSKRDELVKEDIQGVVESASGRIVKVILETALLTDAEKVNACLIAKKAGVDFVKTSTGFGGLSGATIKDVSLMRKTVGAKMGIKAAGGIRDLKTAIAMIDAGATRIGTSTGVEIMKEQII